MEAEFVYLSEGADNVILVEQVAFTESDRLFDDPGNVSVTSGLVVFGLGGDDAIQGRAEAAELINGNSGNDTIVGWGEADTLLGGQGDDVLFAGYFNTPFTASTAPIEIFDFASATLKGNLGSDLIIGGRGADLLLGGADHDTIIGNEGADFIAGDSGNDVLTGGEGSDRFFLRPSDGVDIITDFNAAQDFIVLGQDILAIDGLIADFEQIALPSYIDLTQQGADVIVGTTLFGDMAIVQNASVAQVANQFAIPVFDNLV
ncbi:Hemolysin-type calcium-binding region [Thalassoporum mexicanum PCC 7367]|uniref:calcium-binding protein n=1 Tax=Thalassoporum mexicanum TaxID=3457544 RepID=UPI00029F88FC|nr:calcium-binding protein [Pseudanabaena sp. PCC 7367]AFY71867.1 Hemolysin-type calcium-binding region [Pseudanabaena sp. PCC 7367]